MEKTEKGMQSRKTQRLTKSESKSQKERKPNKAKSAGAGAVECKDKLCPVHGIKGRRVKSRGRVFEGKVIKKLPGRVTIQFERVLYLRKYERYEKRKTKLHARLPDCMKEGINVGDVIQIAETRPISKMIHFIVVKVVRGVGG